MILAFAAKCGVAAVAILSSTASAFSVSPAICARRSPQASVTMLASEGGPGGHVSSSMTRRDVLASVFGVAVSSVGVVAAADAKDDPALKGTKEDPEFVKCVSDCVYFCTKEKQPSKSRGECIPECRKSCATTKAQRMVGKPRE